MNNSTRERSSIKQICRINLRHFYFLSKGGSHHESITLSNDKKKRISGKLKENNRKRDEKFAEAWEKEGYNTNPYYPEQRVYSTKKDELVRSKSEVMLADMYYEMGIPYRYEAEGHYLNIKDIKKQIAGIFTTNERS